MTDRELVLELCRRLNLSRHDEELGLWHQPERVFREEGELIQISQGVGYNGFYVEFKFDDQDNFIEHGVYE